MNRKILKNAIRYATEKQCEIFIIEDNNNLTICDLKELNNIVNKKNPMTKILYSAKSFNAFISFFNYRNGECFYYDIFFNEFFL